MEKKYIGLQEGMKLSLTTNLLLNSVCLVLSFLEHFQPIIASVMWTITINVFKPSAFNLEFQYSYPYLITFHDFANNN
jgi:hypothetical protein